MEFKTGELNLDFKVWVKKQGIGCSQVQTKKRKKKRKELLEVSGH